MMCAPASWTGVSLAAADETVGGVPVPLPPFESEEYDVSAPRRFGPYVVLGDLGTGGMGAVYRALDTRLERQVAVKVLHRETEVSGPRERFLREARLVSSLNHPNICTIFDIGDEDGDPYLVMELLEGESLKDRVMRGPVPAEDIREIAFRVGLALQAAHGKGIVHRDIKPANIFLVHDGRGITNVKVLDFGLAKLTSSDRRVSMDGLTRAGATVGTVEYMSPEQACGEPLDARSDLFSLGAVLYEMATGVTPFHGATSAMVFSELLNRDPTPPRERNLQVPADLDRLIRALLVKSRERRLPSAGALLRALSEGSAEYEARRVASLAPERTEGPVALADEPATPSSGSAPTVGGITVKPANSLDALTAMPEPRVSVPLPAMPMAEAGLLDPAPAFGVRARGTQGSSTEVKLSSRYSRVSAAATVPAKHRVHAGWKVALAAGVVVVVLVTLLVILLLYRRPAQGVVLNGALQMLPIANQTGDSTLDRAPTVGLQVLLEESAGFTVRGIAAADMLAGNTSEATGQQLRSAAGMPGSMQTAVLAGVLTHTSEGYVLRLEVSDAATHAKLAETEEEVASLAEVPVLLTRSATQMRLLLGESAAAVQANSPVLAEEASAVPLALAAYGEAESAVNQGETERAALAYRRALDADAHFQLAELRLGVLLQRMHADSGAVLRVVRQQPAQGGGHLRQYRAFLLADEVSAPAVAQVWTESRPHDVQALWALATARMAAGRFANATGIGEHALQMDPFRREMSDLLTTAELGAGAADAAWQTQAEAYRRGTGSAALSVAAAFLRGDDMGLRSSLNSLTREADRPEARWSEAVYLANAGQMVAATDQFTRAATLAAGQAEMASAQAAALEQSRLNLALAGECSAVRGSAPALPLAAAWCGVRGTLPPTTSASGALRDAAVPWQAGDLRGALQVLEAGRRADPLASLLRGRLHQLLGEPDAAIAEYKAVVAARGEAYLSGTISYPVALAGLAAVYASTGDAANGASSVSALREVWRDEHATTGLLRSMLRG